MKYDHEKFRIQTAIILVETHKILDSHQHFLSYGLSFITSKGSSDDKLQYKLSLQPKKEL